MMETKSTFDNTVALIHYQRDVNSLPQAPDLYQGLQGISSTPPLMDRIDIHIEVPAVKYCD